MSDFVTLQNHVLVDRFDDTTYRDRVKGWLNEAYGQAWRRLELPSQQGVQTANTTPNSQAVALTGTVQKVISVTRVDTRDPLDEIQWSQALAGSVEAAGPPAFWAAGGNPDLGVYVYPKADAAYQLSIVYEGLPSPLSADSDIPQLPTDYHDMLEAYAISRCYRSENDSQEAAVWMNDYELMLGRLGADLRHSGDSGPKQVPGMWGYGGFAG